MFDLPSLADSERLSRFAALAACALAGALGLWLLVRCVWLFVPQGGATAAAAPLVPVAAAQSPAASVAQWHLFGNAQSVDLAARAQNAPRTALKLSLRGTLALADPKQGIAIIANEGNLEHGFKVGDAVGSATLVDVYSDHVVLDHDGAAESLSLPRAELRATASAGANQPGAAPLPNAPASMPDNSTAPAARGGAMPTLAGLNAADLARQVQFEPVFEAGKVAGARLSGSGAAAALMNQVGLKPSDVVTAVNGTPLASVASPQQLLDKLGGASSLQLTVQRDGKPATLTLNLR